MDYIKILDDILENGGKRYDSAAIVNKDGIIEYSKRINNDLDMPYPRHRPRLDSPDRRHPVPHPPGR